jgi:hypothetical protein
LQSLAEAPFEASTSATTDNVSRIAKSSPWQSRVVGLTFRELSGSHAAESTQVRRLSQAKTILRERFTGSIRQDSGSTQELQLIIEPLYRYQPLPPGIVLDQTEVWTSENQVANGTFRMYIYKKLGSQ